MSARTLIQINGQQYDASGKQLQPLKSSRSIDGMVDHKSHARHSATHQSRKAQKTATLHRAAVKKPVQLSSKKPTLKSDLKTSEIPKIHQHQPKVDVPKSPSISRFPSVLTSDFVASAPPEGQHYHESTAPPAAPPMSKSDLFVQRQLRIAEAHQKQKTKKKSLREKVRNIGSGRRKALSISAAVVAGVMILGFAVFQNVPGLSMQLASRRAGFSAMLPSYTPDGYSLKGPVAYSPGKVILSFNSNTNDFNYQIEQQPSRWTADTLREQVASSNGTQYQTYESKGLTIYFTGNNSATWVDRGVLFSLRGDSALSGEQIATIAASM